jgi:hypothetical protein
MANMGDRLGPRPGGGPKFHLPFYYGLKKKKAHLAVPANAITQAIDPIGPSCREQFHGYMTEAASDSLQKKNYTGNRLLVYLLNASPRHLNAWFPRPHSHRLCCSLLYCLADQQLLPPLGIINPAHIFRL